MSIRNIVHPADHAPWDPLRLPLLHRPGSQLATRECVLAVRLQHSSSSRSPSCQSDMPAAYPVWPCHTRVANAATLLYTTDPHRSSTPSRHTIARCTDDSRTVAQPIFEKQSFAASQPFSRVVERLHALMRPWAARLSLIPFRTMIRSAADQAMHASPSRPPLLTPSSQSS